MNERELHDRIGPYRLEGRLGRGGMGEVFLAFDERLERRVAVKRIRWQDGTGSSATERFRREAKAAARLNHPAIVQVYDLISDVDGDAIVMEHVVGQPLADLVGSPSLSAARAVRLAREIAEGLAHAHAAGFVHRDLKAANVMVTASGTAKILDFGLAKPLAPEPGTEPGDESLTGDGMVVGTSFAMSPEQAGGGPVDARSDLFSLGSLLYEMLTGRAPFRGANPLETIKRVLTEEPPPLAVVRPDLPPALAKLVHELLAKKPEARPRSAGEVARRLAELEPGLDGARAGAATFETGMSGLPTDVLPLVPAGVRNPVSSSPSAAARHRRTALVILVLLVLAASLVYLQLRRGVSAAPLRVLVPPIVPKGDDPRLSLAASGVLDAVLGRLASLQGVAVLDPRQLDPGMAKEGTPAAMARAVAADEVLSASIEPAGNLAKVSLRRLLGKDGQLLWTETFQVTVEPSDLRFLAEAVDLHLGRGYPEHSPRSGTPALEVRDEDYAAYLALKQGMDAGLTPAEPQMAKSEEIVRGSPRFLAGLLTAGDISRALFTSKKETQYLDLSRSFAKRAGELAPGDPRSLALSFRVAVASGEEGEPEAALARIEAALPGDPAIFSYRAELADRRGRAEEALTNFLAAAEQVPSWRNLYSLASFEWRNGRIAEARGHLGQILARSPGNLWGTEALAKLELLHGDPEQAERRFEDLVVREPEQRALWAELGLARFLAGHYEQAIAAYRKALAMEPGHNVVLLNLADAELALGRRREAEDHYRQTLDRLREIEAVSRLQADDSMAKAQCLAVLGRPVEAGEIAQRTLQQNPEALLIVHAAALVYARIGDRTSALINAKAALRLRLSPSWFRIAAFDSVRGDPELQSLLRAGALQ